MKATGFFLGYLCCYYVVWELSRYRVILTKANEIWSFTVDFRVEKKRTSSSVSWIVWSSKPWPDNWYKQWRYSHLERWVIQWILYSRTLKKLPAEILSCILLKTQFLQTEKNIENLYITNPVQKKRPLSISTWKLENAQQNYKQPIVCWKRINTVYSLLIHLICYWNFLRSVMSLKKAYDVLRIEASNEIMHAAITMELPSGNCVRKGATVVLHKRIVVKSWQLIVYTKLIKGKPFILRRRKQRWLIQKRKCHPAN